MLRWWRTVRLLPGPGEKCSGWQKFLPLFQHLSMLVLQMMALKRLNPCKEKLRVASLFGLVPLATVLIFEDRNSKIADGRAYNRLPMTGLYQQPTSTPVRIQNQEMHRGWPYPLPSPLSSHTLTVTTATLAWHSTRSHPSSWLENFTLCSGKTTQTQTDLRRFWIGSRTSSTSVLDTRALSFSLFCDVAKKISLICNPRLVQR